MGTCRCGPARVARPGALLWVGLFDSPTHFPCPIGDGFHEHMSLIAAYWRASAANHDAVRRLAEGGVDDKQGRKAADDTWRECSSIRAQLNAHSDKHGCGERWQ